ncbi:MAG: VWA domain-containing protein [Acidobacteria bacterium]|nr:VWA domain-containing protein [Acidobacteriota bacterium]
MRALIGGSVVLAAALLAVTPVLTSPQATQAQPQRPIFRSDAHFVTVDAYPTKDGKVVEGLTAADFIVEEDGKPQSVESFEFVDATGATPEATRRDPNTVAQSLLLASDARMRAFVVYLDIQHVSVGGANAARLPLITFINRLVGENDLLALTTSMVPAGGLTFGRRTMGVEDLLSRNWKWGTRDVVRNTPLEDEFVQCFPADNNGSEGWVRDGTAMRQLSAVLRERAREEAVLENLEDLVMYLGTLREGRTSVILFTEGWRLFRGDQGLMGYSGRRNPECDRHLIRYANMDSQSRLRDIIALANRNNVVFYTVNPGGLQVFDYAISERVLGTGNINESPMAQGFTNIQDRAGSIQTLANNTDGLAVLNTNDLKAGLQRVSDSLRAYYLLGYYSTNTAFDGRPRRIKVTVKQPGVDVTARRGYTAPNAAERAARAAAEANPIAATGPSAVDLAMGGLARLRPDTDLYVHTTLVGTKLTTVAEVGAAQVARGALAKDGVLEVTVTGADGATVATVEVPVTSAMRAASAALDVPAATGSLTGTAKVRTSGGTFEVKTPTTRDDGTVLGAGLVYRATPSARSPLVPVASQLFRRTERVHIEWPVAGPLDSREGRLLGRNGEPVAITITLTEITRDGRQVLALDGLLAPLAPGDYVIEVTAGVGGKTETRLVAIRVVS